MVIERTTYRSRFLTVVARDPNMSFKITKLLRKAGATGVPVSGSLRFVLEQDDL